MTPSPSFSCRCPLASDLPHRRRQPPIPGGPVGVDLGARVPVIPLEMGPCEPGGDTARLALREGLREDA
jgi:hypothetical protein